MRRAVLCLVNVERTSRGLPPLAARPALTRSAQLWTLRLVSSRTFTHGINFAARISAAGYSWGYAGENIASGFRTPREVVRGWMGSEGHCRNILDPHFADIGVGVVPRPTGVANIGATWTQDFGLLLGHTPPSNNTGPQSRCPY
ncbi:MAG: CAP domain-containing protein [Solirubrobacterales bacterium]|nr:CAP domain-containing protein [Solirubrobacterales bacterium]